MRLSRLTNRITYLRETRREIEAELERLTTGVEQALAARQRVAERDTLVGYVIHLAATEFRVREAYIMSKRRSCRRSSRARHAAMYLARDLLDLTFQEIGSRFGRHHSTVISDCMMAVKLAANEPDDFRPKLQRMRSALLAYLATGDTEQPPTSELAVA